uniref:Uncharacterized protein n=1 Tax=Oryza punctata TaxID=4537 RepID=A0A0E0JM16_ORYPU
MVSTLQGDENEMTTWRPSCPGDCRSRFAPPRGTGATWRSHDGVALAVVPALVWGPGTSSLRDDSGHDNDSDGSDHDDIEGAATGEAVRTLEGQRGLEPASATPSWVDSLLGL